MVYLMINFDLKIPIYAIYTKIIIQIKNCFMIINKIQIICLELLGHFCTKYFKLLKIFCFLLINTKHILFTITAVGTVEIFIWKLDKVLIRFNDNTLNLFLLIDIFWENLLNYAYDHKKKIAGLPLINYYGRSLLHAFDSCASITSQKPLCFRYH